MMWVYGVIIFMFGLVFGSFYNVVGFRLPKNLSLIKPSGSFCPKCKHELKWYELIPVLSFVIQGGKCRKCKDRISFFYPCIELTTGILFLFSFLLFGFSFEFLISLLISSFLVIVIVSDINYLIIPDEVTFLFSALLIALKLICCDFKEVLISFGSGALLFALMYVIMLFGNKVFKKESLGGGDIKLMFFVGAVLQPIEGFFSLFIASAMALPVSLIIYWKKKSNIIPFGPFILIGLLLVYWLQIDVLDFLVF